MTVPVYVQSTTIQSTNVPMYRVPTCQCTYRVPTCQLTEYQRASVRTEYQRANVQSTNVPVYVQSTNVPVYVQSTNVMPLRYMFRAEMQVTAKTGSHKANAVRGSTLPPQDAPITTAKKRKLSSFFLMQSEAHLCRASMLACHLEAKSCSTGAASLGPYPGRGTPSV